MNRRQALAGLTACTAAPAFGLDLWSTPAPKVDVAKLRQLAAHTVLLIDVSGSSPIFESGFKASASQIIERYIAALDLGDEISVALVGDPLRKDGGMWRGTVTKRTDASTQARHIRGLLASINRSNAEMDESALVAAVRDASGLFNRQTTRQQTLLFVTDGIERSFAQSTKPIYGDYVEGENGKTIKGKAMVKPFAIDCLVGGCNLGEPHFNVPQNTRATLLGIGLGVAADQQQAIKTAWANLLRKAGFGRIELLTRF